MNAQPDEVLYSREQGGPRVEILGPYVERSDEVLTPLALQLLASLQRRFNGRRMELLAARERRQAEFAAGVLRTFPGSGKGERRTLRAEDLLGRPLLILDCYDFKAGDRSYSVNFYQSGKTQVAVVYQMVPDKREGARRALTLSLESLGVDAEARKLRLAHGNQAPWGLEAPR